MSIHVTRAPTVPLTSYDTKRSSHLKYVPYVIRTIFFVRCIQKVSRVGVVMRAGSLFFRTSEVEF